MAMKRELHTLFIKHDGSFKTLSKIALSQLILKIVYLKKDGVLVKQITNELNNILSGSANKNEVDDAITFLIKDKKLHTKSGRYFIHSNYFKELEEARIQNEGLQERVFKKYFSKTESNPNVVINWFQDSTIKFFEKFSFEWFHQVAYTGKNTSNVVPNLNEILEEVLNTSSEILQRDKEWLKQQYVKFIESNDSDENILFWNFGITMFSARLITARHYADQFSIDMLKNSVFILDTNILMILDLEAHELNASLKSLEAVLIALSIKPVYFNCTKEEYLRAMRWRKEETINIFTNYDTEVLNSTECPFIQTALKRGCQTEEDINRMYGPLLNIPNIFHQDLPILELDYSELNTAIEVGQKNEEIKNQINDVYKKRTNRNKRENPLIHDAGIITGAQFIRKDENAWIITSDSTLKIYAIEKCLRDDNEIAIGLDVVLGLMAVNSGGVEFEASNFAPLFKNLVKYSLIPESDSFEIRDLAFILNSNTKVNELPNERVIEVAKEVKKLRVCGTSDEKISLYLRRVIEGDKLGIGKDIQEAREYASNEKSKREKSENEFRVFVDEYRTRRRGELRTIYDKELRNKRWAFFGIPSLFAISIFFGIKFIVPINSNLSQFWSGALVEFAFGLLPLIPINKKLVRNYSDYVTNIDMAVEKEIRELKKQAN
jgi:hypothetical protein